MSEQIAEMVLEFNIVGNLWKIFRREKFLISRFAEKVFADRVAVDVRRELVLFGRVLKDYGNLWSSLNTERGYLWRKVASVSLL